MNEIKTVFKKEDKESYLVTILPENALTKGKPINEIAKFSQ